jgi:hypothetical protein
MEGKGKGLLPEALMPVGELDPPHFISRRYPEAFRASLIVGVEI